MQNAAFCWEKKKKLLSAKHLVLLRRRRKKEKKTLTKCCVLMRVFMSFCLISLSHTVDLDRRGWIENF
jgi:hypothetical protein